MRFLKIFSLFVFILTSFVSTSAQELKKPIADEDIQHLERVFAHIAELDQKYRSYIQWKTLDKQIITKIDSIFNNVGVAEGVAYQKSLNLSLPQSIKDSLNNLQWSLDLQNHMTIRGIWATYGFIPKSIIKENNFVQQLLLLHPPKGWDIPTFHKEYSELLIVEVHAGRMPAKSYANFYDNILCKILQKPQLYGTNKHIDAKTGTMLPPIIEDLTQTNNARQEIGMPLLTEGEYRLEK